MQEANIRLLQEGCEELGISLSEKQVKQFELYYEMLIEKNKVMNLTAITEEKEVVIKHFLDCLALVKVKELTAKDYVLDLGTGAGFPGIPLKILFPEAEFVLADSLNKRLNFLNEVIEACGLEKITTVHGRAEELARNKAYREKFTLVVSRAVANLSTLSEYCLPYVKIGGEFISYKSVNIDEELKDSARAVKLLGGGDVKQTRFVLPQSEGLERMFIQIPKEKDTPKAYPRKAGTPSKEPLK